MFALFGTYSCFILRESKIEYYTVIRKVGKDRGIVVTIKKRKNNCLS